MSQEGMNWGGITGHRSGIKGKLSGFVQVSSEWIAHERSAREKEEYLEYSKGVSFIIFSLSLLLSLFFLFFFLSILFLSFFLSLTRLPSFPSVAFSVFFFVVLRPMRVCVCVCCSAGPSKKAFYIYLPIPHIAAFT